MSATAEFPSRAPASIPPKRSIPEPLQIVEMLEHILLYLPMRDILLSQRVSKRWHSIITHSKPLQRALYLLPAVPPPATGPTQVRPQKRVISARGLPPTTRFFPTIIPNPYHFNPLIASAFQAYFQSIEPTECFLLPKRQFVKGSSTEIELTSTETKWEDSVKRKEASWRRMLVTQPPVQNVVVVDERIAPDYEDCFAEWAYNEEGVRMGEVLFLDEEERVE